MQFPRSIVVLLTLALPLGAAADEVRLPWPAPVGPTAGALNPGAVLTFLKSVGRSSGLAEGACPVRPCADGDQPCRQNVFYAVLGCLGDGRLAGLPECPDCKLPPSSVTLFRAHGGGMTLYGAVGPRPAEKRLLFALGRAVEAPPLLQLSPAEGGTP